MLFYFLFSDSIRSIPFNFQADMTEENKSTFHFQEDWKWSGKWLKYGVITATNDQTNKEIVSKHIKSILFLLIADYFMIVDISVEMGNH